jgi:diacylglycerol kinase family enzyme
VGNNQYQLEGLRMGTREHLNLGVLHAYVMRHTGMWGLLRLFFSALVGKLSAVKEFDAMCAKELWAESRRKRLSVALDGEVTVMKTPLHYRSRAGALRVVGPTNHHDSRPKTVINSAGILAADR